MRARLLSSMVGLLVAGTSLGCMPDRLEKTEIDLRDAITEAVARGDTATVRLFIEVPFAFERLYIAGPRTSPAVIAEAMPSDAWVPAMSRGIENADHFHLLLFETRGKLVPATLPRTVAELDPALTGRMYGPETAWFRVTVPEGSAVPRLVALPTE